MALVSFQKAGLLSGTITVTVTVNNGTNDPAFNDPDWPLGSALVTRIVVVNNSGQPVRFNCPSVVNVKLPAGTSTWNIQAAQQLWLHLLGFALGGD